MSQVILNKQNKLNCKIVLIVFSLIAFLTAGLKGVLNFANTVNAIIDGLDFNLQNGFFTLFEICDIALNILPYLILILYILFFYKKYSARFFVFAIFLSYVFSGFLSIISMIISMIQTAKHIEFVSLLIGYIPNFIINILYTVCFLLVAVFALFNVNKKFLYIIPISLGMLIPLFISVLGNISNLEFYIRNFERLWYNVVSIPLLVIIYLAAYVVFMMLIINNFSLFIKGKNIKPDAEIEKMSPEDKLKYLKAKFDEGEFTEEEYKEQRSIVINKL